MGVAKVPDDRLDRLGAMSNSAQVVHAAVQFTDIGGLVEGASHGEGLGNAFLSHIREVDAIVFVLRAFPDPDVPGSPDPLEHLRVVEIELALADLASAEKALDKHRRMLKGDKGLGPTVALLERCVDHLGEGVPLYRAELSDDDRDALREFFLLTNKPVMAVLNIGEDQIGSEDELAAPVREELAGAEVVPLSVQLEAEAAQLDPDERTEMLDALGLGEGAVPRFLTARLPPARAAHVPHHRREGEPGVDVPGRVHRPRVRRRHPHRLPARVHPGRDHPVGRPARGGVVGRRPRGRQGPLRGQGLRGGRRRRHGIPLQRLSRPEAAPARRARRGPPRTIRPMPWLVADDRVIASLEVADTRRARRRGLLGRDTLEGALLIERARWVHTIGMRLAIDVAHLDADRRVIAVTTMVPGRVGRPRLAARSVLESEAGTMHLWGIEPGVQLEVRS